MPHVLRIRTEDELIAVIPHRLGFHPHDSLIVMPVNPATLPIVRMDIPHTAAERAEMLEAVGSYAAHVADGAQVALMAHSQDAADGEVGTRYLADGLEQAGIETARRLWANDDRWVDLDSGATGPRTEETANRIAAQFVMAGTRGPAESREAMASSLSGDREPVTRVLPQAREAARYSDLAAERGWALGRLGDFQADGNRLDDPDAARMLVGIGSVQVRDALWEDMSRDNAHSHVALWTDLTARAPDDVRTPAATMLAFSSWLAGDGAKAWCALDQIPGEASSYSMAQLVAGALQHGLHPDKWDQIRSTNPLGDATERPSPAQRHERNTIPGQDQNRRGPAAPGR